MVMFRYAKFSYDGLGRKTSEAVVFRAYEPSQSELPERTISYQYDSKGRVYLVSYPPVLSGTYSVTGLRYIYDSYNRLSQRKAVTGSTVTEDGTTASVTTSAYDKNGNLISQGTSANNAATTESETKAYSYDPNNMMAGCVISQDGTVSVDQTCIYNGDGQRTYKADGEDNIRYYYMDGHVLYTESDVAIQPEEGDSSGDGTGAGGNEEDPVETKITSFNILSPEGGIIASGREGENSDDYFVYTKDVRGSTTNIVDYAGAAVASYTYSDFGETTANNMAAGDGMAGEPSEFYNEICYTGGIYDETTGEYYLNARYYNPSDGRFTTQDSYRGENTDEGTWNLYTYCANSPLIHVDPSGHKYDRTLAIFYALNNFPLKGSARFAYFTVDCANFVSQCLWFGGKKFRNTDSKYDDANAWYSKKSAVKKPWSIENPNLEKISLSWRWCPSFKTFWKNRCKGGAKTISRKKYDTRNKFRKRIKRLKIKAGDAAQFQNKGVPWHTILINRVTKKGDSKYAAHTDKRYDEDLWKHFKKEGRGSSMIFYRMNNKHTR